MFQRNNIKIFSNGVQLQNFFNYSSVPSVIGPYKNNLNYEQIFENSIKNPEEFWAEQAQRLVWFKKFDKVLDNSKAPFTKW